MFERKHFLKSLMYHVLTGFFDNMTKLCLLYIYFIKIIKPEGTHTKMPFVSYNKIYYANKNIINQMKAYSRFFSKDLII